MSTITGEKVMIPKGKLKRRKHMPKIAFSRTMNRDLKTQLTMPTL
jgi:hypothetical protein